MMNHETIELSEHGRQRQESMKQLLIGQMNRYHERRRFRKRLAVSSAVVFVCGCLSLLVWQMAAPQHARPEARQSPDPTGPSNIEHSIAVSHPLLHKYRSRVRIDGLDRYRVTTRNEDRMIDLKTISDEELVAAYQQLGQDGYVVKIGGNKMFVSERVDPGNNDSM